MSRPLIDPIADRQAAIERFCGNVVTLNFIDDPWSDGAPAYWHGFISAENSFRPGSHTVASATGDHAMETLDNLARQLGMKDEDAIPLHDEEKAA